MSMGGASEVADLQIDLADRDLQIVGVEAWACSAPLTPPLSFGTYELSSREYAAIRVRTAGGLVADCLGLSRGAPVDVVVLDLLGPVLLGRDSADISARVQDMIERGFLLGSGGIMARARSLLEICLWDLAAQAADVPLWRLLGAEERSLSALIVACGRGLYGGEDRSCQLCRFHTTTAAHRAGPRAGGLRRRDCRRFRLVGAER